MIALCPEPKAAENLAYATRVESGMGSRRGLSRFFKINDLANPLGWLWPRRIGVSCSRIKRFRDIEFQAIKHAREHNLSIGGIFYACIYDRDFAWLRYASPILQIPWTGLYLHASSVRIDGQRKLNQSEVYKHERIFRLSSCGGVGILDEGILTQMSTRLRKPVIRIPDLADKGVVGSPEERELGMRLKHFAAGRPIVGLFGHLQRSKGMLTILRAASITGAENICFALAGDVLWPPDEIEAEQARAAIAGLPNVWSYLKRIPSEGGFGQLIEACDVLAATYIDFPHSSNILAKAAVYEKPVIVSDGFLMAERVRRFGTGEVIRQENAEEFLGAVHAITMNPDEWKSSKAPRWGDYRKEHSFGELKNALRKLVDPIIKRDCVDFE